MNAEKLGIEQKTHNNLSPYYIKKEKRQYQSSYNISIHIQNFINQYPLSKRKIINRICISSVN